MLRTRYSIILSRSPLFTRDHLMLTIRPPVNPEVVEAFEAEAAWYGNVYGTYHFYELCPDLSYSMLFIDLVNDARVDEMIQSLLDVLEES